jgi:hypothetical protein
MIVFETGEQFFLDLTELFLATFECQSAPTEPSGRRPIMATLTTPPPVQPVNRLVDLFPPEGQQVPRRAPLQLASNQLQAHLEEHGHLAAVLAVLVVVPLALLAVFLWPVVFVALVLCLVAITPFAAGAAGVRAILPTRRRAAG